MPNMANISVLNAAAASCSFVAAVPSAGDKSPAVWRFNAASAISGHRPTFSLLTRDNAAGNGRRFIAEYKGPVVETVSGVPTVTATVPFRLEGTLPTNVAATSVYDHYVMLSNLLVAALIRSCADEGYAPT